uniref:Uncharacterized protein n=1 Tax=Iconisemion striatum TaxID=60296 RepID=A0A1A7WJK3_9TELE
MSVHTDRSLLPSSVDIDLASKESTQTSSLIKGGVGSKLGELSSDPLKCTEYLILPPHNTFAHMGKTTNMPTQASGEPNKEDNSQGNQTSQTTCAANIPAAPLTQADMEVMLQGLEDRITSKLSAQLTVNRALLEQHDSTIQQLKTTMNDMHNRMLELETTCSMLMQENEKLKPNTDDPENWSRCNNICITGLPEKAEGPCCTVFITECLTEIFGAEAFPTPLAVDGVHRIGVPSQNQEAPYPFNATVNFQNKELILKFARERGHLTYRGTKIHIFPDRSPSYPARGPPSKPSPSLGTPAIRTRCSSP